MIPVHKELAELANNMRNVNFSLWYNKFIPIEDNPKRPTDKYKPYPLNNEAEFYKNEYEKIVRNDHVKYLLNQKHVDQVNFYTSFDKSYIPIFFTGTLVSPLITGIGESHPHEISMVFDHNIGIPYIPASGIKGIVRLAHIINIVVEDPSIVHNDNIELDDENLKVIELFGNKNNRGEIIFLDSYPLSIPKLRVDILNPHYGDYYADPQNRIPPADYLQPVPVKFLTVQEGTKFIFRCLLKKTKEHSQKQSVELAIKGIKRALEQEGVGAKSSLEYGRFSIEKNEPKEIKDMFEKMREDEERRRKEAEQKAIQEKLASMTDDERMIFRIEQLKKDKQRKQQIGEMWSEINKGSFGKEVFQKMKEKLIELGEWEPYGGNRPRARMLERKNAIEKKLNK